MANIKLARYGKELGDYVPLVTLHRLLVEMTSAGREVSAAEQAKAA